VSEVTSVDGEELGARVGELRPLTIMFCDVVGSTELSTRWEPEAYRELIRGYRAVCRDVIESQFEGHIVQIKGDGVLAVFGFPVAHENDAERAVRAARALVRAVHDLSASDKNPDRSLEVRAAVHRGPLYVDFDEDDVYGLAANVGARLQDIAEPGAVVLSDEIRRLVEDRFEIEPGDPRMVKGVADPLQPFRVVGERRVPLMRSWSTPLVERDDELERLRRAWARRTSATAERAARAVLVCGDAGVGKSRLVAAFVDEVCSGATVAIELQGSPFHLDAGFHPVRSLIEYRCEITEDTDPSTRLEHLARDARSLGLEPSATLPLLAALAGIAPSAGYRPVAAEGRRLQEQIAEAALAYIAACAAGKPTVIVAENLHWFDAATRDLLVALTEAELDGVLVLGTSRNRERGPWETIGLNPLTQSARLELIDALEPGLSEHDRLALAARSGGVPLYLEELVRAGADRSRGVVADPAPVPGSVPAALYEPLVARLYATPMALPVAAAAAAAGEEVDRSLLTAALTISEGELDSTLGDLLDAQILEPVAARQGRYHFRHELLREVAYELQPPSWRRKVHGRLGDFLTGHEPSDSSVLASHFERAERYEEAADAYQQSAEDARRRGGLEEARSYLARAIDLIAPLAGDAAHAHREVQLRLRRAFLAMSADIAGRGDAGTDYERCLELAAAEPQGDDMISTLISLWAYDLARGDLARVRRTSEVLRAAVGASPSHVLAPNLAGFGIVDWFAGRFASALDTLVRAIDLVEVGDERRIAAVWFVPNDANVSMHVHLAIARFMTADVSGGDESLAQARAIAGALDFPQGPFSTAYADWLGSWMWIESGNLDRAAAAVEDLQTSSARHGFDNLQLLGATQAAALEGIATLRSDAPDTTKLAEQARALGAIVELWKATDVRVLLPFYITTTGTLLAAAGDADGALRRYDESLQLAAATGMRFYDAETARCIALLAPDRESKTAALREALELARSQDARPFELRIALDLHESLGDEGRPQLERAMAAFGEDTGTAELEQARVRLLPPH
jgi:class 3 adenylate cyclase/tetratricopeptide (TPR) repeat protein